MIFIARSNAKKNYFKKTAHCLVQRLILCKTRIGVKHCIMLCKNRIPHFINPAEGSFQAHHNGPLMSRELLMWFALVRFPNLYFDSILDSWGARLGSSCLFQKELFEKQLRFSSYNLSHCHYNLPAFQRLVLF